ncbi:MAG: hypothetical protein OXE81_09885 [Gammaproteobacteria bacterium]|nr:hypothetical protein [Gammaproteobacteria bacterium]
MVTSSGSDPLNFSGQSTSSIQTAKSWQNASKTPIEVLQSAYDSGEITVSPSVALEG